MTRIPAFRASWTRVVPTPPLAPRTRIVCPERPRALRCSISQAVTPLTTMVSTVAHRIAASVLDDRTFVSARQVDLETILQHDVVAERFGTLRETRSELQTGIPAPLHTSRRAWLDALPQASTEALGTTDVQPFAASSGTNGPTNLSAPPGETQTQIMRLPEPGAVEDSEGYISVFGKERFGQVSAEWARYRVCEFGVGRIN